MIQDEFLALNAKVPSIFPHLVYRISGRWNLFGVKGCHFGTQQPLKDRENRDRRNSKDFGDTAKT